LFKLQTAFQAPSKTARVWGGMFVDTDMDDDRPDQMVCVAASKLIGGDQHL